MLDVCGYLVFKDLLNIWRLDVTVLAVEVLTLLLLILKTLFHVT